MCFWFILFWELFLAITDTAINGQVEMRQREWDQDMTKVILKLDSL